MVRSSLSYVSHPSELTGFAVPDFAAPFDLDAFLAHVPPDATCKGLVFDSSLQAVRDAGVNFVTNERFLAFRDYPISRFLEVNCACARALAPDQPVREGVRRLGQNLFPAFAGTLLGRVMYGVFSGNVQSILRLANKSFEQTQNIGRVQTRVLDPTTLILHFTNAYTLIDCYHVGVIEGTLRACGVKGEVSARMHGVADGELLVTWLP